MIPPFCSTKVCLINLKQFLLGNSSGKGLTKLSKSFPIQIVFFPNFGSLCKQCVLRMRLRPFTTNTPITDITNDPSQYFEDPDALKEKDLFDNQIPTERPSTITTNHVTVRPKTQSKYYHVLWFLDAWITRYTCSPTVFTEKQKPLKILPNLHELSTIKTSPLKRGKGSKPFLSILQLHTLDCFTWNWRLLTAVISKGINITKVIALQLRHVFQLQSNIVTHQPSLTKVRFKVILSLTKARFSLNK